MNMFVNHITTTGYTANGAITHTTTGNYVLDLFSIIGSYRGRHNELKELLFKSFIQDRDLTIRCLLWARDVRGGAGERTTSIELLKEILPELEIHESLCLFIKLIEIGRAKDLLEFLDLKNIDSDINNQVASVLLHELQKENKLVAKWLPRQKATKGKEAQKIKNRQVRILMRHWAISDIAVYRRMLSEHSSELPEYHMCRKDFSRINYDRISSLAGLRYSKAFERNDEARYAEFKESLVKGEVTINASTLFPHDVVNKLNELDENILDSLWNNLPNYLENNNLKFFPVIDVSGSMLVGITPTLSAMDVAVSLGIYTAERGLGVFKNLVCSFHNAPKIFKLEGKTIKEKCNEVYRLPWGMSTNLQKVFEEILTVATSFKVPQEDMPDALIIISDMEFNMAFDSRDVSVTNFLAAKEMFAEAGYKLPKLIFWNVMARVGNSPVQADNEDALLISGFSPAILKAFLNGEDLSKFTPELAMREVLMVDRYTLV